MSTTANNVLAVAAHEIGNYFRPGTPSKYGIWFGIPTGQFCAMGLSWVADKAGATDIIPRNAYTPSGANWFKARGQWHQGRAGIRRGDLVYFDFPGAPNRISHVAIVESATSAGFTSIEFNTSGTVDGDQRNGGLVARKHRSNYVVGYGRPVYGASIPGRDPVTPPPASRNGDDSRKIVVDGIRGPAYISRWQEVMGTAVDGVISSPRSALIEADQRFLNNGVAPHIKNLTGRTTLTVDGAEGPATFKVRQFWLLNHLDPIHQQNLIGHPLVCDGVWGRESNLCHQYALNLARARSGRY